MKSSIRLPVCEVHEKLALAGKVEPLDNCAFCIRNHRDELKDRLRRIHAHCVAVGAADNRMTDISRETFIRIGEIAAKEETK